jgi:hypothetical protein
MSAMDFTALIGQEVEMTFRDSKWGDQTLRWGTLRSDEGDTLIIDNYHDSAGLGMYLPGRGCNVKDGVPVTKASVVRIAKPRGFR